MQVGASGLERVGRYIVLINHSFICVQVVVYLFCFIILICWLAFLDLICGSVKLKWVGFNASRCQRVREGRS
jgi:hypothetical protein